MIKKYFPIHLLLAIFLTFGLSVSAQNLLAAWTAPTASPPTDNIFEPINVGDDPQVKGGALGVTGNFTAGLAAKPFLVSKTNSFVGIGTASVPGHELNIVNSSGNAEIDFGDGTNYWGIYNDQASSDLRFWRGGDKLTVKSDGTLKIEGTIEIGSTKVAGAACSSLGAIAKDSGGAILSCQSGVWTGQTSGGYSVKNAAQLQAIYSGKKTLARIDNGAPGPSNTESYYAVNLSGYVEFWNRHGNADSWVLVNISQSTIANWRPSNPISMKQNYHPNNLANFILLTQEGLIELSTDTHQKTIQAVYPWE